MDKLSPATIKATLKTTFIGKNIVFYQTIGSTNDVAKALAAQGAPEGTLVLAEEQTAGRGRMGRRWIAPPRSSLLMSLIFYPSPHPVAENEKSTGHPSRQAQQLVMLCSVAAVEAIESISGLSAQLKWPNDILVNRRKAGGILAESGGTGERLDYLIMGLGLNVNLDVAEVEGIPSNATSLASELGRPVPRLPLLCAILEGIERRYLLLQSGQSPLPAWAARLLTLHRPVTVVTPWGQEHGWAEGVDEDGALLLRREDGHMTRILAGDVTLR